MCDLHAERLRRSIFLQGWLETQHTHTQCHLEASTFACGAVHGWHGGGGEGGQGRGGEAWRGQLQCCVDGGNDEEQLAVQHGAEAADEPHLHTREYNFGEYRKS